LQKYLVFLVPADCIDSNKNKNPIQKTTMQSPSESVKKGNSLKMSTIFFSTGLIHFLNNSISL